MDAPLINLTADQINDLAKKGPNEFIRIYPVNRKDFMPDVSAAYIYCELNISEMKYKKAPKADDNDDEFGAANSSSQDPSQEYDNDEDDIDMVISDFPASYVQGKVIYFFQFIKTYTLSAAI